MVKIFTIEFISQQFDFANVLPHFPVNSAKVVWFVYSECRQINDSVIY